MDLQKLKHEHTEILANVSALRKLVQSGIQENAAAISAQIVQMSSLIKLHLAVEDSVLYPALQKGSNPALAKMAKQYQSEMANIASAYISFARRWHTGTTVAADPEGFRQDANQVLKVLHERVQKENTEFYPAAEAC
jgi:iron-sulfur cluster repair protein YtfE (RIC family)